MVLFGSNNNLHNVEYKMNYYQSLNTNNKIFFLKYQVYKLEKLFNRLCDIWESYIEDADDPEWDMCSLYDDEIMETEEKMKKVKNLLKQKELKLKLIKKYYEPL